MVTVPWPMLFYWIHSAFLFSRRFFLHFRKKAECETSGGPTFGFMHAHLRKNGRRFLLLLLRPKAVLNSISLIKDEASTKKRKQDENGTEEEREKKSLCGNSTQIWHEKTAKKEKSTILTHSIRRFFTCPIWDPLVGILVARRHQKLHQKLHLRFSWFGSHCTLNWISLLAVRIYS